MTNGTTAIEALTRRARVYPPPAELTILDDDVDEIAQYLTGLAMNPHAASWHEIAAAIRKGGTLFMAIPVRVVDGERVEPESGVRNVNTRES